MLLLCKARIVILAANHSERRHAGLITLFALALVSAAVLNFEVLLTRHIAIEHWHHLTTVVIAIALLGFGVAGSVAMLLSKSIISHYRGFLLLCSLALVLSFPISQLLASMIPLNMLALPWFGQQFFYLLLYALCWLPPFFLAGLYIIVNFMRWPRVISRLYGADLIGAALGAALALFMLEFDQFAFGMLLSPLLAMVALLLLLSRLAAKIAIITLIIASISILLFSGQQLLPATQVNAFKELSIRQNQLDAKLLWQRDSAQSRLSMVSSSGQHASPGLSLNSESAALPQWQLFLDGAQATPILLSADKGTSKAVFAQSIYAAPYQLLKRQPDVLLLGADPSWNSWTAYWQQANSITLIDQHKHLLPLLTAVNAMAEDNSTEQVSKIIPEQVKIANLHPRRFVETTTQYFDLIMASIGSDPVGSAAFSTNYLMTLQGLSSAFAQLEPNGVLAISNIMAPLPRDNLRVINTVVTMLRQQQLAPRQHLLVIRDWRTLLLLVSKQPINKQQAEKLYLWSQQWRFDLAAFPGLTREQANRYHIKSGVLYFDLIAALTDPASEVKSADLTNQYAFDIAPSTDHKPYLFHSFRWQSLGQLIADLPQRWPLLVGWGYILSLASLALIAPLALIFIMLPLYMNRQPQPSEYRKFRPLVYFSCLGFGFMAIEIALLQQTILLLDSLTSALATVLSAVLIGSGAGSILFGAKTISPSRLMLLIWLYSAVLFSAFIGFLELFQATLAWSHLARISLVFIVIAVLTMPLGLLLPYGLRRLPEQQPMLLAWCWAINGFASVTGVLVAPIIAMEFGLQVLLASALCCYLLAGWVNLASTRS
ncbi:hypothetical protein ND16A_1250 [Thalassotalea sp. ND16A]|nr:hypothetical protein ND16A_1250 [Thalassotalea sp. ND16A]